MAVIAKMNVIARPRPYGENQLVELCAVCAEELMYGCGDGSAKANENLSFQQASPNGDAKITLSQGVEFRTQEEIYLIVHRQPECPEFAGAMAVVDAQCSAVTDFGGVSKLVEVSSVYRYGEKEKAHPLQVSAFNMRMTIDNPNASVQFEPGKSDYWIGLYRASEVTMAEALAMARPAA
jgi:hypothetical protein